MVCNPHECTGCGECEAVCEESAIVLNDGFLVSIDEELCVQCGACAQICPTNSLSTAAGTFRVLVGGKLGRHPQLGRELVSDLNDQQVLELVGVIVEFFKANAKSGERLGALINRVGWEDFRKEVL